METHEMMKNVYGDQCMSHTHDEPRLGWPSISCDDTHVAQVHEIVYSIHCLTMREIAEECNILLGSCHDILTTKS
jgi:hypothetical protein